MASGESAVAREIALRFKRNGSATAAATSPPPAADAGAYNPPSPEPLDVDEGGAPASPQRFVLGQARADGELAAEIGGAFKRQREPGGAGAGAGALGDGEPFVAGEMAHLPRGGGDGEGETFMETISVRRDAVGFIIGRNGQTIKSIMAACGAQIETNRSVDSPTGMGSFTAIGSQSQVRHCLRIIQEKLDSLDRGGGSGPGLGGGGGAGGGVGGSGGLIKGGGSEVDDCCIELWVPLEKVGLIIGSGGATIRGLREKSLASISVHNEEVREGRKRFALAGPRRNVERAHSLIAELAEGCVMEPIHPISASLAARMGGTDGAPPTKRHRPQYQHCGEGGGEGEEAGGEWGGSADLGGFHHIQQPQQQEARAEYNTKCVYIPAECVAAVVGRNGATVRELQERSGASIKITPEHESTAPAERLVTISGSSFVINRATDMLNQLVEDLRAGRSGLNAGTVDGVRGSGGGMTAIQDSRQTPPGIATPQHAGRRQNCLRGSYPVEEPIYVAADRVGLIVGKEGHVVKDIQTRSGAEVSILDWDETRDGPGPTVRTVLIGGTRPQVELAKTCIEHQLANHFSGHSRGERERRSSLGHERQHSEYNGYDAPSGDVRVQGGFGPHDRLSLDRSQSGHDRAWRTIGEEIGAHRPARRGGLSGRGMSAEDGPVERGLEEPKLIGAEGNGNILRAQPVVPKEELEPELNTRESMLQREELPTEPQDSIAQKAQALQPENKRVGAETRPEESGMGAGEEAGQEDGSVGAPSKTAGAPVEASKQPKPPPPPPATGHAPYHHGPHYTPPPHYHYPYGPPPYPYPHPAHTAPAANAMQSPPHSVGVPPPHYPPMPPPYYPSAYPGPYGSYPPAPYGYPPYPSPYMPPAPPTPSVAPPTALTAAAPAALATKVTAAGGDDSQANKHSPPVTPEVPLKASQERATGEEPARPDAPVLPQAAPAPGHLPPMTLPPHAGHHHPYYYPQPPCHHPYGSYPYPHYYPPPPHNYYPPPPQASEPGKTGAAKEATCSPKKPRSEDVTDPVQRPSPVTPMASEAGDLKGAQTDQSSGGLSKPASGPKASAAGVYLHSHYPPHHYPPAPCMHSGYSQPAPHGYPHPWPAPMHGYYPPPPAVGQTQETSEVIAGTAKGNGPEPS